MSRQIDAEEGLRSASAAGIGRSDPVAQQDANETSADDLDADRRLALLATLHPADHGQRPQVPFLIVRISPSLVGASFSGAVRRQLVSLRSSIARSPADPLGDRFRSRLGLIISVISS